MSPSSFRGCTFQIPSKSKSRSDLHQNLSEFYAKNHQTFPNMFPANHPSSILLTQSIQCHLYQGTEQQVLMPSPGSEAASIPRKLVAFVSTGQPISTPTGQKNSRPTCTAALKDNIQKSTPQTLTNLR